MDASKIWANYYIRFYDRDLRKSCYGMVYQKFGSLGHCEVSVKRNTNSPFPTIHIVKFEDIAEIVSRDGPPPFKEIPPMFK